MSPRLHCAWMIAFVVSGASRGAQAQGDGGSLEPRASSAQTTEASTAAGGVLPPIQPPTATEADLEAAWAALRQTLPTAGQARDEARAKLMALRTELGIVNLEPYSLALVRAAQARASANDPAGAIELAAAAVELSPDSSAAHFGQLQAFLFADVTELGRAAGALGRALGAVFNDPPQARALLADVGGAFLFAALATLGAVAAVLFLRYARGLLHDFLHLLPGTPSPWLGGALGGCLLLAAPVLLRASLFATLAVFVASVAVYLTARERAVAAALFLTAGLLPLAAQAWVAGTTFAGTAAEDVYLLERGGVELGPSVARIKARRDLGVAGYAELFALGHFQLRRGQLDEAISVLTEAVGQRAGDARATLNLGNALAAKGNLEGAIATQESAAKADPTLAAAPFNLSRLYARRAQLRAELAALELDRSKQAFSAARAIDPSLATRGEPSAAEVSLNRALLSAPLAPHELAPLARVEDRAEKVAAQLERSIFGVGLGLPSLAQSLIAAAFVAAGGLLARLLRSSRACSKCGTPACRRCDPELSPGSPLCQGCVAVFARAGQVAPTLRVRKQIEIARYQDRRAKLSYLFGVLCSGAGHLYTGVPVVGTALAFGFLFFGGLLLLGPGLLRPAQGDLPLAIKLTPVVLALLVVYLLALRALHRRQA